MILVVFSSLSILTFHLCYLLLYAHLTLPVLVDACHCMYFGSMQLCVDAAIPECFGGVEGQSIYIDTEGSFVAERVAQISKATVEHCHAVSKSTGDEGKLVNILYQHISLGTRHLE